MGRLVVASDPKFVGHEIITGGRVVHPASVVIVHIPFQHGFSNGLYKPLCEIHQRRLLTFKSPSREVHVERLVF